MGYGVLVVGHKINLNPMRADDDFYVDTLDDELRQATDNELWLSGGEDLEWRDEYATGFICKSVSFLSEVYGGAQQRLIDAESLDAMRTWLKGGLPNIHKAEQYIQNHYPTFHINPDPRVYLVLNEVNATTSTDLYFGAEGTLSYSDTKGWSLEMYHEHDLNLKQINEALSNPSYSMTKEAYRDEMARIGEDDDEDFFYEFEINQKSNITDLLEKYGISITHIYDEYATSWDVICGTMPASLYKDTHMQLNPTMFNRRGGRWFHKIYMSG